jgi:hypothetical protein
MNWPAYSSILVALFVGAMGVMAVGGLMKVFGEKRAYRITLASIAILLPPLAASLAFNWRLSDDATNVVLLGGGAIGWICLGFYPSSHRFGKWTLFLFYPLLVWIAIALVYISVNGFHIL